MLARDAALSDKLCSLRPNKRQSKTQLIQENGAGKRKQRASQVETLNMDYAVLNASQINTTTPTTPLRQSSMQDRRTT